MLSAMTYVNDATRDDAQVDPSINLSSRSAPSVSDQKTIVDEDSAVDPSISGETGLKLSPSSANAMPLTQTPLDTLSMAAAAAGTNGGDGSPTPAHLSQTHPALVAKQHEQEQEILAARAVNNAVNSVNSVGVSMLPGYAASQYASGSPMSIASLTNPQQPAGLAGAGSAGMMIGAGPNGGGAQRRKRQCSLCHGWFSNLVTHKSTHLETNSRPHVCEACGRGFARPNDLFRHEKSHNDKSQFHCPLFVKAPADNPLFGTGMLEPSCHQTGGFSRCDTYKNHLKAMHFEYPAGTKKRDRPGMSGKCKGCNLQFENADRWITDHIETETCEGIRHVKKYRAELEAVVPTLTAELALKNGEA